MVLWLWAQRTRAPPSFAATSSVASVQLLPWAWTMSYPFRRMSRASASA